MNSVDWLKSVQENAQKSHIPPEPPEAATCKNAIKTLIPPVAPRTSVYLKKNGDNFVEREQKEIYWGEIQKAVYLSDSSLSVGSNYQVQVSSDLITWTNYGSVFTATNANWRTTNYWDVINWNQLFFRLQQQ